MLSWQGNLQEQTEQIVAQSPQCHLGVVQPRESLLRPAYFLLQLVEGQGRWVQERGRGTAGDIVTNKGEDVDQNRQSEDDTTSS